MNKYIIGAMAIWLLAPACYYHKEELLYPGSINCNGISPSYATGVLPIIQTKCSIAGCHDAASVNTGGPFTTLEQVRARASSIRSQVLSGAMPQNSSLTVEQLRLIVCWIDSGTPNN